MGQYVERGCRKGVYRGGREEVSKGVVIQGGLSSDRWGAQRRLSCTMTVSYNAEYVERGCRKGVQRGGRDEVQSQSVERECLRGAGQLTMLSMQRVDVERGCREEVKMKFRVRVQKGSVKGGQSYSILHCGVCREGIQEGGVERRQRKSLELMCRRECQRGAGQLTMLSMQ